MSHRTIRRIPRSCVSYHPGHQVHWIHAKKAHEPQPEITVVVTVHDDGHVELDGDELHLSLWNHGPAWLQSVLDQAGHHGLWKPRFHALFAPRYGGRIFNLAALDHLTDPKWQRQCAIPTGVQPNLVPDRPMTPGCATTVSSRRARTGSSEPLM